MKEDKLSRREFILSSALTAGALTTVPLCVHAKSQSIEKQWQSKKKSGFTMWQIPSHKNTIGNSYVFRTTEGKVIVMDGGFAEEEFFMRGFIGALGGVVDGWFISHPHTDHAGALLGILKDPQDMKIKMICHSSITEEVRLCEKGECDFCRELYDVMGAQKETEVIDMKEPGRLFQFDGMHLKILSVANEFHDAGYNDSSMIMRVWDKKKSLVFLGDAGPRCGKKALDGPYKDDLNCEYLQMAHHGQNGCDEEFYRSIKFRACLWPTPIWVWNNDQGGGYNTGTLNTFKTRSWMDRLMIREHHVSCLEGLWQLD